jgi:acrylyl-CoA reductase (NADPH)
VASAAADLGPVTPVIVHGYDLGVAHHGGFAAWARVPAGWVVPLPPAWTPARPPPSVRPGSPPPCPSPARAPGTGAGDGPVLVTGATGGVGSMAVALLASRGYEVVASTGKASEGPT